MDYCSLGLSLLCFLNCLLCFSLLCPNYAPVWPNILHEVLGLLTALLEYMTVLLKYLDFLIFSGRAEQRFGGPSPTLGYATEKETWRLKTSLSLEAYYFIANMPIMPALCSKFAYYASIMFDALARLLCLKLCRHNQRWPNIGIYICSKSLQVFHTYLLLL